MSSERILQQEKSIRIAGALLMLAPIGNLLLSVLSVQATNKWTMEFFRQIVDTSSAGHWYLKISCVVVGAWMAATAKRSSWLFALIVLGLYIGYGIVNFKSQKMVSGWFTPTLSLISNIGFFGFIYFVEFQHAGLVVSEKTRKKIQKVQDAVVAKAVDAIPLPIPTETEIVAQENEKHEFYFDLADIQGFVLDFEKFGPWGQIEKVTEQEIYVHAFHEVPPAVLTKPVEILLNEYQQLQFRLTKTDQQYYVFKLDKVIEQKSQSLAA